MSNDDFILQFFKANGIRKPKSLNSFYSQLTRKFGQDAHDFMQEVEARSENGTAGFSIYQLKNSSLAFSDEICSQFDSDRLRKFIALVMERDLNGSSVLDLGCDNGFVLCCLAKRFPTGKFVGIDTCENAIAIAKERAKKFNLTNVEFYCGTMNEVKSNQNLNQFDLVITAFLFHEIIDSFEPSTLRFSYEETDQEIANKQFEVPELIALRDCLSAGVLISMDRWADAEQLLFWIRLCEKHGFSLQAKHCTNLEFYSPDKETVPVTVFARNRDDKEPATINEILNIRTNLNNFIFSESRYEFADDKAEHAHMLLDYVPIFEETYDSYGNITKTTLGQSEKFAVVYQTNSSGTRLLNLQPPRQIKNLWSSLVAYKEIKKSMGSVTEKIMNEDLFSELINS